MIGYFPVICGSLKHEIIYEAFKWTPRYFLNRHFYTVFTEIVQRVKKFKLLKNKRIKKE